MPEAQRPPHAPAPLVAWYAPAPQAKHALAPAAVYLPAAHSVQFMAALPAEYEPARHAAQVDDATAPVAVENEPAGQPVHALEPEPAA